ncbi:L-fucose permease [Escherichia coli]|nr:L-fucose permease [Escherichia coli]
MGNTSIQTQSYRAVDKDAGQSRSYIIPFALLCSLFFLWAVANNLNDILLPQFQQAFTLTNFQAGLIQSAFYFGYFIIPIPAGILMKKLSYKAGIITGLFFICLGCCIILARRRNNELHLIFSWPIYYCSRIRLSGNCRKPFCYGIRAGK